MPYFFILPAFVVYVVAMVVTILVVARYHPTSRVRPYLTAVLVWSSTGLLSLSVVYMVVMLAAAMIINRSVAGHPSTVAGIALAVIVFIGPFAAAAAGLAGGALFAIHRTRQRVARGEGIGGR